VHVASVVFDVRIRGAHSLKDKRAVVRPVLDGCRRRFAVAAAEVGHQDQWQQAGLGMATVSGSDGHAREVLDAVERFVWSFPELEVISCTRDGYTTGEP